MEAAIKPPLVERINFRALCFGGLLLFLLGWPVYTFLAETLTHGVHNHGSYKAVDLKALGFFQMDPHAATLKDVPAAYRALDGQRVLLEGLIDASREAGPKITEFTLLYSRMSCCVFGAPTQVQERVYATANPGCQIEIRGGADATYEVMGTLHVTLKRDEDTGEVVEVYHLDAESIKPVH